MKINIYEGLNVYNTLSDSSYISYLGVCLKYDFHLLSIISFHVVVQFINHNLLCWLSGS